MNHNSLWRYVVIIALTVLGVIYALPNIYGDDYAIQLSPRNPVPIQAGFTEQVKQALHKNNVQFINASRQSRSITILFPHADDQIKGQDVLQAAFGKDYAVALNLISRTPAWLRALGASPMRLGLDLRGGVHFLLYVDVPSMLKQRFKQDTHAISSELRNASIRYSGIRAIGGQRVEVTFNTVAEFAKGQALLEKQMTDYRFASSEKNPLILTAQMKEKSLQDLQQYAVTQNITTLNNRINDLGVAEPVIQQQGREYISVDLPGIQDMARAKAMIGKVATIRLQLVDVENDAQQAAQTGIVPFGDTLYQFEGRPYLLKNTVILSGQAITNAASTVGENGRPAVSVQTTGSEVANFYRVTGNNIGRPIAGLYVETKTRKQIVDGKLKLSTYQDTRIINVATIMAALSDFNITGLSSQLEAKDLALMLRSGAYTAPVSYAQERSVGPSLGKANIDKGVLSCEVGSLMVILFMTLYYRVFGLVANFALILNVVFVVAVMSILGATMTLPGIAGVVLTVGMAVDANVLINERIREELRLGLPIQSAIRAGYDRAFSTIVDANLTTLIVALVLFALGTGSVQGFAVTLSIGLVTSMITAIFFTRTIVNMIYGHKTGGHLSIGIKVD